MKPRQPIFNQRFAQSVLRSPERVHRETRAALEAEKLYLQVSGELRDILDAWPTPERREEEITRLMRPRLFGRFASGVCDFEVHIQEGIIAFKFRHDDRLGGGPDNPEPWARAMIPLRLIYDEPSDAPIGK